MLYYVIQVSPPPLLRATGLGAAELKQHLVSRTLEAILYYTTILHYATLYYTILYYAILCYTMLCYTILYYTIL